MINMLIEIIGGIFAAIFGIIWDILKAIFGSGSERKRELDADFMPTGNLLSSWNKGFSLNGKAHLSVKNSNMSAMVLGGSGSGKSVTVAIPTIFNLAENGHSICVNDPSSELYRATAAALQAKGYNLKVLHYSDPNISDGYNPMARATDVSSMQKVASMLVRSALGEKMNDPFWSTQSVLLISLLGRILQKQNFWFQNLTNLKLLLDNMTIKPEALDILAYQCKDSHILSEYKQFLVMDKKLLTSITSTCRAALALFTDPSVQTVTSFDSVDFEAFRKEKTVLYIQNRTGDMKYYAPLSAIFFEQFFGFIMERLPQPSDKNIFFILDEASSLYLPTLQIALANLRKFKSGIVLIAQDFNQFIHLYGTYESEAIGSNCYSKIYFPGQPLATAQILEKRLGVFEYEDEKGNRRTRPLMTADEIIVAPPDTSIIIAGANRAIQTKMRPYFKSMKYKRLSSLPLPILTRKTPFEELPLIQLPTKPK